MGAWGKIVGGGIGAVLGGPIGAGIGAMIGHAFDGDDDEPAASSSAPTAATTIEPPFAATLQWVCRSCPHGPALQLQLEVTEGGIGAGTTAVVLFRNAAGDAWVPSSLDDYADKDGDLGAASQILDEGGRRILRFIVPFAAFPTPLPQQVDIHVVLADGAGTQRRNVWTFEMPEESVRTEDNLLYALALACVSMFRAAGPLQKDQVKALRTRLTQELDLTKAGVSALKTLVKRADAAPHPIAACVAAVRREGVEGAVVVGFLQSVGEAAGGLAPASTSFLSAFAEALGVSMPENERPGASLDAHYRALELSSGASLQEVRAAYRRLIAEYHPDKVNNLPKGFQEFANQRTVELNVAYQALVAALRV
jgi:hypothetical protein